MVVKQLLLDGMEEKTIGKVTLSCEDTPGQTGLSVVEKLPQETFFCRACLTDLPLAKRSQDNRYCNFCYQFLKAETELLTTWQEAKVDT